MKTRITDTIRSKNYVENHVCRNDYYEKGQTIQGYWRGASCSEFGVERDTVGQEEDWKALQENKHTKTGEQLTVRHNTTRQEQYIDKNGDLQERVVQNRKDFADMTTGAPKTVSVGAVVFKSELIHECYRRAHRKLIKEAESLTGRQAHNGKEHIYRTGNFAALDYEHTTNRCLEPHLHNHLLIINATKDPKDARNYAIEFGELAKESPYLTAVGADALAYELHSIGVETEIDEFGMPQIIALREYAEIYSERTKQIEALIDRIEEHAGTTLSNREAKTISLGSRGFDIAKFERLWERNKSRLDGLKTLDPEKAQKARREILDSFTAIVRDSSEDRLLKTTAFEVEANQQSLLSAEQKARGMAFVASLARVEVQDRCRDIKPDIEFAIEHVFANKSVVKEYELLEQILLHAQGKNVDIQHMKDVVASDHRLLFGRGGEVGVTEHYRQELEMLLMVEKGRGQRRPITVKDLSPDLNETQKRVVKESLETRDKFSMLIGSPGVGKTYCLAKLTDQYLKVGRRVFILSPENGAREVIKYDASKLPPGPTRDVFANAQNLDEFLVNSRMREHLGKGDLVILDEAAMAHLENMVAFMKLSFEQGFDVQFAGDDGQLNSIKYGDAFRVLRQHSSINISLLDKIVRQSEDALDGHYRTACELFSKGKIREGMWELYQAGVIKEIRGGDRLKYYADRILESLDGTKPAVACNITHRENDSISGIVRARRKNQGDLTDERPFLVHRSLGWTPAQKREVNRLQPGMILESVRGKNKGKYFKVLKSERGKVFAEDPFGTPITFGRWNASMFNVCSQHELKVSPGDPLRTHSAGKGRDKGKEIINGEAFTVGPWAPDGLLRSTDGKIIDVRNLSYGYMGTVRKVQGSTKEKNLFGLDRKSIKAATPQIVNVACTRGRESLEVIVENAADIAQIEFKSSHRKGVCEMGIDPDKLPVQIKELVDKLEQDRNTPSSTMYTGSVLDLQAAKRIGRKNRHVPPINYAHELEIDKMNERERG